MEFENFLEINRRHPGKRRFQTKHDDQGYSQEYHHSYHEYDDHVEPFSILQKIRNSRKLKILVVLAVILILTSTVTLIIVLQPLLKSIYIYVSQNGLKGLLEVVTVFINKLWNGSAK
jgi:hypothetical protein